MTTPDQPADLPVEVVDMTGQHVETFDSMEAMFDRMAERQAAAMAGLQPWQREMLPSKDFYWMRHVPEMDLVIFGHHDFDAAVMTEKAYYDQEGEGAEYEHWLEQFTRNNFEEGRKFGLCFSIVEPTGELGSTHVATMLPLSKEGFEQAKQQGWRITGTTIGTPLARDLARANQLVQQAQRS